MAICAFERAFPQRLGVAFGAVGGSIELVVLPRQGAGRYLRMRARHEDARQQQSGGDEK
jgi:hypothetical protein